MQARMDNPAIAIPGAMEALHGLTKAVLATGISPTTLEYVNLHASQINGCSVCLQMHARDLRKAGESDEKIDTVAGWRESPFFSERERAARRGDTLSDGLLAGERLFQRRALADGNSHRAIATQ